MSKLFVEPQWIDIKHPYSGYEGELYVCGQDELPFDVKRVFWISGVPSDKSVNRGEHAHKTNTQILVSVKGSFWVKAEWAGRDDEFCLGEGGPALYVPTLTWIDLCDFSPNAVCVVLCSEEYKPESYLREKDEYHEILNSIQRP